MSDDFDLTSMHYAEPDFGMQRGHTVIRVHALSACEGRDIPCCIHSPSGHHMREWEMNWRSDTGVMERLCPHGIGHPDPDHMKYVMSLTPEHDCPQTREYGMNKFRARADWDECEYPHNEWQGIHSCDGCCIRPRRKMTVEDYLKEDQ